MSRHRQRWDSVYVPWCEQHQCDAYAYNIPQVVNFLEDEQQRFERAQDAAGKSHNHAYGRPTKRHQQKKRKKAKRNQKKQKQKHGRNRGWWVGGKELVVSLIPRVVERACGGRCVAGRACALVAHAVRGGR